ncbi:MAG: phosphoribosyltransferase family protein [Pyrobaculum sp.]
MSAGLFAIYSFQGSVNLYPFVYYGLRAMANRGDVAVAYILGETGELRRVEVDFSKEAAGEARGVAAVGCVSTEDCCRATEEGVYCAFGRDGVKLGAPSGDTVYVGLLKNGVVYAYRPPRLWHLAVGAHGFDFAIIATESSVIEILGGDLRRSLRGGELLKIHKFGVESAGGGPPREICAMELIYASRLDSVIDGAEIAEIRARLGEALGKKAGRVDVVIGVPDTGLYYAAWAARAVGAWHAPGFVSTIRKRSALLDEVKERISAIQLKANVVRHAVAGKRVLVVDDSIISGLTLRHIAQLLRIKAGAKEVHAATAAPPLRSQCPYGVKMPPESHMIFNHLDLKTATVALELDSFFHLDVEEFEKAVGMSVCTRCFVRP